jgi:hypothetical protein
MVGIAFAEIVVKFSGQGEDLNEKISGTNEYG